MKDIDLSAYTGQDFNIIGYFKGVFDGNGHTIANFTYTLEEEVKNIGIFGYANWAHIKDLRVNEPNIVVTEGRYVGALAGSFYNGVVTRCTVECGRISGKQYVGGLIGIHSSSITECSSSTIVLVDTESGGLVGYNDDGSVSSCYSAADVTGTGEDTGGLIGSNYGIIQLSNSTGKVVGSHIHVGGLIGENIGNISNCYSKCAVQGGTEVGGLVGHNYWGEITSCFWDIETSGWTTSSGGTDLTTDEMQMASTFLEAGWDFVGETDNGTEDIWWILEGKDYPRLWWEDEGN